MGAGRGGKAAGVTWLQRWADVIFGGRREALPAVLSVTQGEPAAPVHTTATGAQPGPFATLTMSHVVHRLEITMFATLRRLHDNGLGVPLFDVGDGADLSPPRRLLAGARRRPVRRARGED